MTPPPDSRWLVYGILITLAAGLAAGRIASVERLHEPSVHKPEGSDVPRPGWPTTRPDPSPTFSSNDRSRWATARALVEKGSFIVGRRTYPEGGYNGKAYKDEGIIFEDGFGSVDKVLKPDTNEFYSSKPPLLTLLMAAEYWVVKNAFGWTMAMPEEPTAEEKVQVIENRFHVTRVALVTFNLVPYVLYLVVLAWLAERFGTSDWARYFIVGAGAFATLVSPFLITINNHTLATVTVAVVLYAVVRIREEGAPLGMFVLGGFAAGLSVSLEQPSLALAAGVFVYLAWYHPARSALFAVAALVPVAVSLFASYAQLGEWSISGAYAKFGTEWYQYEGSHWVPPGVTKRGIDFAGRNGETRGEYAFHLLLGHHGFFSLMPVMLLSVVGMGLGVVRWVRDKLYIAAIPEDPENPAEQPQSWTPYRPDRLANLLLVFTLLVSAVLIGFYLYKSDNYGGWSNGPRWLMWLSPLWLIAMLPALDWLAKSRWGRLFALVLLAFSVMSMNYQNWNPWRHPWIYNWMESRGWIDY